MARRTLSQSNAQPQGASLGDVVSAQLMNSVLGSVFDSMNPNSQRQQAREDRADERVQQQADQFDRRQALDEEQFGLAKVQADYETKVNELTPSAFSEILSFNPKRVGAEAVLTHIGTTYGALARRNPEFAKLLASAKEDTSAFKAEREKFKTEYGADYPTIVDGETKEAWYDTSKGATIAQQRAARGELDKAVAEGSADPVEAANFKDYINYTDPSASPIEYTSAWLATQRGKQKKASAELEARSTENKTNDALLNTLVKAREALSKTGSNADPELTKQIDDLIGASAGKAAAINKVDLPAINAERDAKAADAAVKSLDQWFGKNPKDLTGDTKNKDWTVGDDRAKWLGELQKLDPARVKDYPDAAALQSDLANLKDTDVVLTKDKGGNVIPVSGARVKAAMTKSTAQN